MRRATAMALGMVAAAGLGCGTLGGDGGGARELPNRGVVPYEKVTVGGADAEGDTPAVPGSPWVLRPEDPKAQRVTEPSAVVVDGRVVLYVELRQGAAGPAVVARAESDDGVTFGPLETVLAAEDGPDWLGGTVGAPSVVRHGDGWLMAFAAAGGLGLARSDDGRSFTVDAEPIVTPEGEAEAAGIGSPSLVVTDTGLVVFYEARAEANGRVVLARASATDGRTFTRDGVVLEPGTDCVDAQGNAQTCWDAMSLLTPEVRLSRTATGRTVWRLFYGALSGPKDRSDLGFAASFDGLTFERFRFNPVVEASPDERAPTNVLHDGRYLLYFTEDRTASGQGIALAIDDTGAPSEVF